MKSKIILLTFATIFVAVSFFPAMGQSELITDDRIDVITISTDKKNYLFDEVAQIRGEVSELVYVEKPSFQPTIIILKISGPDGYKKNISMFPDLFLKFQTDLKLQKALGITEGIYNVSVEYADGTALTQFSVGSKLIETEEEKEESQLTMTTNKASYLPGETATISASTNNLVEFEGLKYVVLNPDRKKIYLGTLFPDIEGVNAVVRGGKLNADPHAQFSTTIFMDIVEPVYGTYTIKGEYSTQKTESTFQLIEDIKEDKTISLTTDKPAYGLGDKISISGRLNNLFIPALDLEILQSGSDFSMEELGRGALDQDKTGVLKILDGVTIEGDYTFSYEFTIPNNSDRYGEYRVTVSKEIGEETVFFKVVENPEQFTETSAPFSISTNKAVYDVGEKIVIFGNVLDHKKRTSFEYPLVSISIMDEQRVPLTISAQLQGTKVRANNLFFAPYEFTAIPDITGNFRIEAPLSPSFFEEGTYFIEGNYDERFDASTLFAVKEPFRLGETGIILHLNKEVFGLGEDVHLTGIIPTGGAGKSTLGITITKPDGDTDKFGAIIDGGRFSWNWTSPIFESSSIKSIDGRTEKTLNPSNYGVYKISVAQSDNPAASILFKISPNPKLDTLKVPPIIVTTEKAVYEAGDTLRVLGTAQKRPQGLGKEGLVVPDRAKIVISSGIFPFKKIYDAYVFLDTGGNFESDFILPVTEFKSGKYKVIATYQGIKKEAFFDVDNEFDVGGDVPLVLILNTDKDEYGLGETVQIWGKPSKLVYLENIRVTVIHENDLQTTCGSFICGRPGVSSAVFPSPSGSFTYDFSIPTSSDAKGKYEVIADTEFGIFSTSFTVTDVPSQMETSIVDKQFEITKKVADKSTRIPDSVPISGDKEITTTKKSYNSISDLCGNRLCSIYKTEIGKKEAQDKGMVIELFDVHDLGSNWFKVTYRIFTGNEGIEGASLLVTSDISSKRTGVTTISVNDFTYSHLSIQAHNPDTIKAELVYHSLL